MLMTFPKSPAGLPRFSFRVASCVQAPARGKHAGQRCRPEAEQRAVQAHFEVVCGLCRAPALRALALAAAPDDDDDESWLAFSASSFFRQFFRCFF